MSMFDAKAKIPHILLAEDDDIIAELIQSCLEDSGYLTTRARDGQIAWEYLSSDEQPFDALVLDRSMPRLDGLSLLKKIKQPPNLLPLPVIMATSMTDAASVQEGIEAGAYYYLAKPFRPDLLLAIIHAALEHCQQLQQFKHIHATATQAQAFITQISLRCRTFDEAHLVVGWLAGFCPAAERSRVALGLQELLTNAIEHGNLGIDYQQKCTLLTEGSWFEFLRQRLNAAENQAKWVEVRCEREGQQLRFTIQDQGNGFDWRPYWDFDPERLFDPNGRGIATARLMGFDELEYLGNGNTVRATVCFETAQSVAAA